MNNLKGIITLLFFVYTMSVWSQNGGKNTFHQVKEKETLYSLSRMYNVPIKNIIAINPGVEEGLSIGQKIIIPQLSPPKKKTEGKIHVVKGKETLYSISKMYNVEVENIKKWNKKSNNSLDIGEELIIKGIEQQFDEKVVLSKNDNQKIHIVKEKETLYAISKKYNVAQDDLIKWNKLTDNSLSVGQRLVVKGEDKEESPINASGNVIEKSKIVPDTKVEDKNVTESKITNETEEKKVEESIQVFEDDKPRRVKNASGFEEIVQTGLAELIEGATETRKYLALHASAKVGTIMKVRNEMNNQMVVVRVIGRIPDTGDNNKILIKVSKAAYARLGALNKRFRVEVSYMP